MKTKFKVSNYSDLKKAELYTILALRQRVFVIEQACPYQDIDNYDQTNQHIMMLLENSIIGYARIIAPGAHFDEASFGRFLIAREHRGQGLADKLIQKVFDEIKRLYGNVAIKIEAQEYLTAFYEKHGFKTVSEPFDLDGISHVAMLKK